MTSDGPDDFSMLLAWSKTACEKICNTSSKTVFLDIIRSMDSEADNIVAPMEFLSCHET